MQAETEYEVFRDTLKSVLDHCTLSSTLEMLAEICWLQSEHLESDWQDSRSALLWRKAGHHLERASQAVPVSQVSIHARRYTATAAEVNERRQRLLALCRELRESQPQDGKALL
jgi:hypothetical protein